MDSTAVLPTQKPYFWLELVTVEPSLRLSEHTVCSPTRQHASGFDSLNFVWFKNFYWQKGHFTKCYRYLHTSWNFFPIMESFRVCTVMSSLLIEERSIWWYLVNLVSFNIYSSNLFSSWISLNMIAVMYIFFFTSELPSASRKRNWYSIYQFCFCLPGALWTASSTAGPKAMSRFLTTAVTMQKFCSSPWWDATKKPGYSCGMTWALALVQRGLGCSQRIYQVTMQGETDPVLSSCQPCRCFLTMSLLSEGTWSRTGVYKGCKPFLLNQQPSRLQDSRPANVKLSLPWFHILALTYPM